MARKQREPAYEGEEPAIVPGDEGSRAGPLDGQVQGGGAPEGRPDAEQGGKAHDGGGSEDEGPAGPGQGSAPAAAVEAVEDDRGGLDKSLQDARPAHPMPDNPGQVVEEIVPLSTTNLLDSPPDLTGGRDDRVLPVVREGEGEDDDAADVLAAKEGTVPPEAERAELTIFNTRPGDEPGREMRDHTAAPPDYPVTGTSEPELADDPDPATLDPLRRVRKLRGDPQAPEKPHQRLRHDELATELMRRGVQLMRERGQGDDFHFLNTSLQRAVKQLRASWRTLTNRAERDAA